MRAVALSVGDEPLQWLRQGGIFTLIHAENPAQEQAVSRNWRRNVERAGPVLLIVVLVVLWQVLARAFDIPKFLLPAPTDVAD